MVTLARTLIPRDMTFFTGGYYPRRFIVHPSFNLLKLATYFANF